VSGRAALRVVVLVGATLLLQTTVMLDIRIAGMAPDIMLLLPIAAGLVAGPTEGAVVGFVAGIAADLLLPAPFGLTALVGTLIGFAVGVATTNLPREIPGLSVLVALVASAIAVMLYAVLGAVLGESQFLHADLAVMVPVVSVANAILAVPAVRLTRRALMVSGDRSPVGSGR
jgi:rod shape-determining protein MreD